MAQSRAKNPTPAIDMAVRPLTVEVRSASRPGLAHRVTLAWCDCEDFFHRHANGDPDPFCKHIVEAYARVAGWHKSDPGPDPK